MLANRLRWLPWLIVILAFIGFADAAYLTAEHFLGGIPVCVITKGCDTVLTSRYSMVGLVPVALIGALYYLIVLIAALNTTSVGDRPTVSWMRTVWFVTALSGLGFLASLGFVYLQVAVIRALCIYCLTSAGTSTLLFASSLSLAALQQKQS